MGQDLAIENLFKAKNELLDKLINNFESWDGDPISGIDLININQSIINELGIVNEKLSKLNASDKYNEEHENKLSLIIKEQGRLMESLREKKNDIKDNISQLKMKGKVIDSYMNKRKESIFIDKDL